jgi:DNA-binding FadR family transcriptional regulator
MGTDGRRLLASSRATRPLLRIAKVAEAIAHDIVRKIAAENAQPGTQLPSEPQMVADYGVSRASLREALRVLEIHGLITIKPGAGGGPVVAGVDPAYFGRMATLYFQVGGMTFNELIEARLVIEPVMARLAAERRDPLLLEELIAAGSATQSPDDETYLRSSKDFHRLIAAMAGNRVLSLYCLALEDIFHDRVTGMLFPPKRRGAVAEAHKAIAEAIARGDATGAEALMREHMELYATYVRRRHPTLIDEVVDWR